MGVGLLREEGGTQFVTHELGHISSYENITKVTISESAPLKKIQKYTCTVKQNYSVPKELERVDKSI